MEVELVAMETKPAVGDRKDGFHPDPTSSDPLEELGFNQLVSCSTSGSVDLLDCSAPQINTDPISYPKLRDVVVVDTGQQQRNLVSTNNSSDVVRLRMTPEDGLSTPPLQPDTTLDMESGLGNGADNDPIRCEDCGSEFHCMAEYYQHRCSLDDECGKIGTSGVELAPSLFSGVSTVTTTTATTTAPTLTTSTGSVGHSGVGRSVGARRRDIVDGQCSFNDFDSVGSVPSDVETFDGKIVYNPDGSAYIIDGADTECSDDEISLDLPRHEGSIVDGRGLKTPPSVQTIPTIVNAFHVSRNPTLYNAMYGQAYANLLQDKKKVPEAPIMHSYRVYSVRDKASDCTEEEEDDDDDELVGGDSKVIGRKENEKSVDPNTRQQRGVKGAKYSSNDCSSVPIKPILMCFICKLSFGNAKSFIAHAMGEHSMALNEEEKGLMNRRNTSAIVQGTGKDKSPLLSFLEPVSPTDGLVAADNHFFAHQSVNTSCASSLTGCNVAAVAAVAASIANSLANATNASTTTTMTTNATVATSACSSSVPPSTNMLSSCSNSQLNKGLQSVAAAAAAAAAACAAQERRRSSTASHPVEEGEPDDDEFEEDEDEEDDVDTRTIGMMRKEVSESLLSPNHGTASNKRNNLTVSNKLKDPSLSPVPHYSLDNRKSPVVSSSSSSFLSDRLSGDLSDLPNSISPMAPSCVSPGSSQAFPNLSHSPSAAATAPTPNMAPVHTSLLTSSPLGVCSEHPNGRASGVECPKCDMILGSSRSLGGHMTMMHSRNSCKTLKCPKCNWHYKYQETLEIHMKEKHPENETTCIYCITNQPHPRLARGETYTCGYKPYRCDVCNYSTTTKGNLSIHMQSDKHLNNMQELQNGGMVTEGMSQAAAAAAAATLGPSPSTPTGPPSGPPVGPPSQKAKPKPTWRCDVCNYETNVARNLRIHMTSEKHTHNMMVLQQNVKHMQQLSAFQAQAQALDPALLQFHPGLTLPGEKPPPHTEAALADMAYNQALLIQLMTGGQLGQMAEIPMDMGLQALQESLAAAAAAGSAGAGTASLLGLAANAAGQSVALGNSGSGGMGMPGQMPMDDPNNTDPNKLFQCCVCSIFGCEAVDILGQHLQQDRTKQREHEILMVMAGNYVCKLCSYKTNLKANFQLHCKTDKHLQRLQHINHIKEGGLRNEWKLKYLNVSNPIQVKCNACNYYTNSTHKLQLHVASPRHELDAKLFRHLQACELGVSVEAKYYHCTLCNFSSRSKVSLIQHVHSVRHMRGESLRQLHRKSPVKDREEELNDTFQVREMTDGEIIQFDTEPEPKEEDMFETDDQGEEENEGGDHGLTSSSMLKQALLESTKMAAAAAAAVAATGTDGGQTGNERTHSCPYCNYTSGSEVRIQAHILSQHTQRPHVVLCPLCQEDFKEKFKLEKHLVHVHNVTPEGLQRLLVMVDNSQWLMLGNPPTSQSPMGGGHSDDSSDSKGDNSEGEGKFDEEVDGVDKMSDQCDWTDEYRCQMCSKSYKNIDDLYSHQNELGHFELKQTPRGPGYLCWKKGCNQYFKTAQALQVHFREIHAKRQHLSVSERHVYKYRCSQCSLAFKTMEKLQLHSQYHIIRDATKCVLCGRSFRSIAALQRHVETSHMDLSEAELEQYRASLANNPLLLMGLGGQTIDASAAAELIKKESTKGDDCYDMDDEAMDLENMHGDDLASAGLDAEGVDPSDLSMGEMTPKEQQEQQMLDDYLNSQTMAEDSYNNPFRKYKCHRCKVAFTKQSYLTSHNKTLLHRKGERLSYPMEKYLDPNRPYKCDVCKESFTQKNILLVHYNSVSHLHKLKRSIQEQNSQGGTNGNGGAAASSGSGGCSSGNSGGGGNGNSGGGDSDKKPYKCNICKVAYSQGSTLDIHMRSVLHQTRASKLQELALTGQVDLTQPLIEQPEPQKVQDQHKKILTEMLSTKASSGQLNVPVSAAISVAQLHNNQVSTASQVPNQSASHQSPLSSPVTNHHSGGQPQQQQPTVTSPIAQPPVLLPPQVSPQAMFTCQRCGSIFVTHDALVQHQQLYCFFQPPIPMVPPVSSAGQAMLSNFLSVKQSSIHHNQQQLSPQSLSYQCSPTSGETFSHQRLSPAVTSQHRQETSPYHQHASPSHFQSHQQPPPSESPQSHSTQQQQAQTQQHMASFGKFILPRMKSSSIYKHLMESYGFELVMQFNEYHQRRPRKEELEKKAAEEAMISTCSAKMESNNNIEGSVDNLDGQGTTDLKKAERERRALAEKLPELSKSACPICKKEFSSIWVLKAHKEEIHNSVVPLKAVEKFSEEFKTDYEKRNPPQAIMVPTAGTPESTALSEPSSSPADMSSMTLQQNMISPQMSMSSPQMSEINAAINAMAASQMSQMPFNPMMLSMGLGLGLPLGMSMPALAAMNLHPPLIPIMMPPPMDPMSAATAQSLLPPGLDQAFLANQQKLLQSQQQQQQPAQIAQQKRARTRINDEQLKILRAHFDINNSPTEEQIMEMAEKSGLPPKVIKHWFRNTLFKERQRNKDSPYNFSNPPSTSLNLEEYEKTGETKTTPLHNDVLIGKSEPGLDIDTGPLLSSMEKEVSLAHVKSEPSSSQNDCVAAISRPPSHMPVIRKERKTTSSSDISKQTEIQEKMVSSALMAPSSEVAAAAAAVAFPTSSSGSAFGSVSTVNSSALTPTPSSSSTPSVTPTLSEPTTSQSSFLRPNPSFSPLGLCSAASAMSLPNSLPTTPTSSSPLNSSNLSKLDASSAGKRANRTRFTDYQIKVLQEFFESNAYPKDDDLEYLSKLLNLSPRVIVVWFQNARQKARKVYENQPPVDAEEDSSGRFQRTPGLNYQCKKCLLVFQRYYELIKHQKSHCFKGEEDQQQRLRSQLSCSTPGAVDDTNSVSSVNDSNQALDSSSDVGGTKTSANTSQGNQEGTFRCDKCSLVFPRFDLWREHQIIHIMNPNLFPTYPPDTPFGILQFEAQQAAAAAARASPPKRKLSEDGDDDREDQPRDKRLRTTILPEQLDYLYQKYQIESNPSRKMLENIAREVGLKKRVVQVWFQNTRARERKGQFRAHQQVINKRCPYCPALFKVKSALESHLATKHSDQFSKGEINIDNLPDEEPSNVSDGSGCGGGTSTSGQDNLKLAATNFESISFANAPNLFPSLTNASDMNSLKKYYEDSLKRYLDELALPGSKQGKSDSTATDLCVRGSKGGNKEGSEKESADAPLDLSKPVRLAMESDKPSDALLMDNSERGSEDQFSFRLLQAFDDTHSDSHSESTDNMDMEDASHESNPTSPASSTNSHHRGHHYGTSKRFRTQMTTIQLKVMKALFNDYKTPTMAECEMLGREIGLPKRVVQVWFQNARAKEKKNKLVLAKAFGQDVDVTRPPDDCKFCSFKYSHKYSIQDHIFTKKHIDNVKIHLINLKKYAERNEQSAERSDAVTSTSSVNSNANNTSAGGGSGQNVSEQNNASATAMERSHADTHAVAAAALAAGHSHLAQLHMMQMAAAGLPVPTSMANMSLPPVLAHSLTKDMLACTSSASTSTTSVTMAGVNIKQEPKEDTKNKDGSPSSCKGGGGGGGGSPAVSTASGLPSSLLNPFGDLSGLMSGDTAGLLPYMYTTGIPGYYPGVPGSFFHPAMYAGMGARNGIN